MTLACVSNPIGGPYVGNALWQGVRLADLFAEVGVDPASTQLLSTSVDGWTCGTPVSSLTDGRNAMLAVAMNGEPLPAEHGYPVRMVVPGEYGYVSATKWVVDMEFTTWEAVTAYWVPRGWSQQAPMKTMTRIEVPEHRASVAAGCGRDRRHGLRRAPRHLGGRGARRRRRVGARRARRRAVAGHLAQVGRRRSTSPPASTRSRRGRPTDWARCRPTRSPTSLPTARAATTSSADHRRVAAVGVFAVDGVPRAVGSQQCSTPMAANTPIGGDHPTLREVEIDPDGGVVGGGVHRLGDLRVDLPILGRVLVRRPSPQAAAEHTAAA